MQSELLRFKAVQQAVGLSRSTLWRLEGARQFPRRRQLSAHAVGWVRQEIEDWISNRAVAGRSI